MTTVMCFGTFDTLHPGHLYFLRECRRYGDNLVVVIARDATVAKVKGKKPKYSERERKEHIQDLKIANRVVLGYEADPYEIIEEINPNIICLGYDQNSFSENLKQILEDRGLTPKIIRMRPYREEIYKSSKLA